MLKTKRCYKCDRTKPYKCFSKNKTRKDGLNSQCKDCQKKYKDKHYTDNKDSYVEKAKTRQIELRKWLHDYKSKLRCTRCGFSHPAAIQFHHQNPSEKEFSISSGIGKAKMGKDGLLKEIQKCIPLCANCHMILHYEQKIQSNITD